MLKYLMTMVSIGTLVFAIMPALNVLLTLCLPFTKSFRTSHITLERRNPDFSIELLPRPDSENVVVLDVSNIQSQLYYSGSSVRISSDSQDNADRSYRVTE